MENGPGRHSAPLHPFSLRSVQGSHILPDVSSEQYGCRGHSGRTGFATRAKTAGTGRSRRRSRARKHLRAAVPAPVLTAFSSLCPSQTDSRAANILFSSAGAATHLASACSKPWAFPALLQTYQKPCHRGINIMSFWDHCSQCSMNSSDTEFLPHKSHICQGR